MKIASFDGQWRFLSNFWPCQIQSKHGYVFPSVENAFQWGKDKHPHREEWLKPFLTCSPGQAKKSGRTADMRPDWNEIRVEVMYRLLKLKFKPMSALGSLLMNTVDAHLEEGNYWHDNFWGSCVCAKCGNKGTNTLGKLLMRIRDELWKEAATR